MILIKTETKRILWDVYISHAIKTCIYSGVVAKRISILASDKVIHGADMLVKVIIKSNLLQ